MKVQPPFVRKSDKLRKPILCFGLFLTYKYINKD